MPELNHVADAAGVIAAGCSTAAGSMWPNVDRSWDAGRFTSEQVLAHRTSGLPLNRSGRMAMSASRVASTACKATAASSDGYDGPPGYRATVPPSVNCCRTRAGSTRPTASRTSSSTLLSNRSILCVYSNVRLAYASVAFS